MPQLLILKIPKSETGGFLFHLSFILLAKGQKRRLELGRIGCGGLDGRFRPPLHFRVNGFIRRLGGWDVTGKITFIQDTWNMKCFVVTAIHSNFSLNSSKWGLCCCIFTGEIANLAQNLGTSSRRIEAPAKLRVTTFLQLASKNQGLFSLKDQIEDIFGKPLDLKRAEAEKAERVCLNMTRWDWILESLRHCFSPLVSLGSDRALGS